MGFKPQTRNNIYKGWRSKGKRKARVIWMFDDKDEGLYDGYWETKSSCMKSNHTFEGKPIKFIESTKERGAK
jgi:hypothetical protein